MSTFFTWADPEGGGGGGRGGAGVPDPLKNHKNIGFIRNTGPDSLKITKLWRLAGVPMLAPLIVVFGYSLS